MKKQTLTLMQITAFALAMIFTLMLMPATTTDSAMATGSTEVFIGFEDGTMGGFELQGDAVAALSNDEARSGNSSLLLSRRNDGTGFGGLLLSVAHHIIPDTWYEVSFWVLLKTPEQTYFNMHTELRVIDSPNQWNDVLPITAGPVYQSDGWTQIKGYFYYDSSKHYLDDVKILLECTNPADELYIDDFSFRISEINQNIKDSLRLPSLYGAYERYFNLGSVGASYPFGLQSPVLPLYRRHFNTITIGPYPENVTFEKGIFDFSETDMYLNIVEGENFTVHGHVLIYRMHHAEWLTNNADGTYLSRTQAMENMETYIDTVAGRYRGRYHSWDVVNEAVGNFAGGVYFYTNEPYIGSPWYMAFANGADRNMGERGSDHIEYAFRFARTADPDAKLYYNDNIDTVEVAVFITDMVKQINDKWLAEGNDKLLIEGIGYQSHLSMNSNLEDIDEILQLLASIGVDISISELDLRIFDFGEPTSTPTEELFHKQALMYAQLFQLS